MKLPEGCGVRAVGDALPVHLARVDVAEKLRRVGRQRTAKAWSRRNGRTAEAALFKLLMRAQATAKGRRRAPNSAAKFLSRGCSIPTETFDA